MDIARSGRIARKQTVTDLVAFRPMRRFLVPDDSNLPYDMLSVVKKVVDEGTVFEVMPDYARNILCGFARMDGRTVGVSISTGALLDGGSSLSSSSSPFTPPSIFNHLIMTRS